MGSMSLADRYQWLFRKTPALTVSLDQDGYFLDASDAWLERFGYGREEISVLRPEDMATPEFVRVIKEEYRPLLRRTGLLDHMAVSMLSKTGEVVNCITSAIVELSGSGDYLRTVVIYTEAEEHAEVQRYFRRLYRATPAMLHAVDPRGHILYVSDRWLNKLGYARPDVMGKPITDFMARESQAALPPGRLQEVIASGALDNEPRVMLTRSGEEVEVLLSSVADRDQGGEVKRLLVAVKDVTERNQAERELRKAFEENAKLREELERERDYLREEVHLSMNFGQILGESSALKKMLARVAAVAETSASVLIEGESGVGKELVAHVIHASSPRADKPLVKVNCASIPRELFESEFFGHVKGAFTGAHRDRVGRFQLADGGTLFLDEVGEIPLELQGKLLRVLQENEFERVGDEETHRVDVRVVAATNQDLEAAVEAGRFREDLFYRLSVFPVDVPPLRDRGDDIIQLASHFLAQACKDFRHAPMRLSGNQVTTLKGYDWPGNVRELKNIIERAVILSKGKTLRLDLGMEERSGTVPADPAAKPGTVSILSEQDMKALVRANILRAMEETDWRVSGPDGAAQLLGLKPTTLNDRLKAYGMKRPRGGASS
jgi:PAS domain S-box-containing protein